MKIGDFTRENVAKFLEVVIGPELRPIEDFHAVCDGMDIPWATEEGRDTYQRIMELSALRRKKLEIHPMDLRAVCDGMDIPWATEEGREEYQRVMKLAAALRKR